MRHKLPALAALAAAALAAALVSSVPPAAAQAKAAQTNLLTNPGFEAGNLSGWTCSTLDSAVKSPVHSGSYALAGAASSSDDAQCSQTVSVKPSTSYTLSGWVEGNYVYIGESGGSDDWTPSATSWQQLTTTFTTGASTTSITVYVHGWYAQGTYYADDLSLIGPGGGGGGGTPPGAPTGLTVSGVTSSSVSLSWTAPSGTVTGYYVYKNGSQASTVTGTSATVSGLAAKTTYTFTVAAYNSAGTGPQSGSVSATTSGSGGGGGGSFAVAPYVDMTNSQEPMLNGAITEAGLKAFTAAFVIGSGCTPIWGDTLPVTNDPTVTAEIQQAESEGATPIVSFGGADGVELAQSCTNLSSLEAAYQSVINTLGVTHIDFDIEGAGIADTATNNLRFEAINELESANPGLVVSLTIPTLPSGPDYNGDAFLQQAEADGTNISVVNVMAMDYYGSWDSGGADMGSYAVDAAENTLSFLKTVWPGATYSMVGVTPMIGQNDDSAEIFTEADAQQLVSFAQSNGLGRLAFWSVDRDQPCSGTVSGLPECSEITQQPLDFTKIFVQG